jgi:hypothetical protein
MRKQLLPLVLLALIAVSANASAAGFEVGMNRPGGNFNGFELDTPDPQMCQDACDSQKQCKSWTFVNPGEESPNARCWLKSSAPAPVADACCTSGLPSGRPFVARPLPKGNWRQTCRNGVMLGRVLQAECQGHNGDFNTATLELTACPTAPIANKNGRLVCGTDEDAGQDVPADDAAPADAAVEEPAPDDAAPQGEAAPAAAMDLPRGPWRLTCRNGQMNGTMLQAECKGHNGDFNSAGLDLAACPDTAIANNNGQLVCGVGR